MALRTSLVAQPHLYMGDTQGRPLDAGKVYFGEANKDPELYPIDVFYDEALTIAAPQPIRTMGGFMNASGQMVEVYAAETEYSVKVLDGYGRQVFYQTEMSSENAQLAAQKLDTGITATAKFGGVARIQAEKNSDTVSVKDFGAVGDGVTDDTTALQLAINYACANKRLLHIPAGIYVVTQTLWVPETLSVEGESVNLTITQNEQSNLGKWNLKGVTLLFKGAATKECFAKGVTNIKREGGVVDNAGNNNFAPLNNTLELASYYEEDSNGTNGATPLPFSAGIAFKFGVTGCQFKNIQLVLNFDGVQGYVNKTLSLADDWDCGIYMDNNRHFVFDNVYVKGYWRKNGLLMRTGYTTAEDADGYYGGGEENKFRNCTFQGWKSVGVRGIDLYRCLAATPTYIELPWANNYPFDMVSDPRFSVGQFGTYRGEISSMRKEGDRLRLYTKYDVTEHVRVGDQISIPQFGNGVAGTVFQYCRFEGMFHTSDKPISDPSIVGAMPPSSAVEVSGARVRGVRFEGSKSQCWEEVQYFIGQSIDVVLGANARFEGGGRMVSIDRDAGFAQNSYRVHIVNIEQDGADFSPDVGSKTSRFNTTGFWKPNVSGFFATHGIRVGGTDNINLIKEVRTGGYTPAITGQGGGVSFKSVARSAEYQKIGRMVTFQMRYSGKATVVGNPVLVAKLPPFPVFTNPSYEAVFNVAYSGVTLPSGHTQLTASSTSGDTEMLFKAVGSGVGRTTLTADALLTDPYYIDICISGSYLTDI